MKKIALGLMMAALFSLVAFAGTTTFDSLDLSGDIDVEGTANLDNLDIDGTFALTTTTAVLTCSSYIYNYTPNFRIGYDADSWLNFAIPTGTGDVTITQTGSSKSVTWTAAAGFDFVGAIEVDALTAVGNMAITGDTTQTGSITLLGAGGDLTVGDDLTVADDIILSGVISHEWNPDNIQTSSFTAEAVTAAGCAFGDPVIVGAPRDVEDLLVSATVTSAGTITIVLGNNTAGEVDLQTGSWNVFWFDTP